MSIREIINLWVADGEISFIAPAYDALPTVRYFFASPEVSRAILGPWETSEERTRYGRARGHVDLFITGQLIALRMPPSKSVDAHTALLEERRHEAWEMRPRNPKPGIRIFGRFSEKDTFIALTTALRENLVTDDDWQQEIERCKKEWRKYFNTFKPFSGRTGHCYASNVFLV